MTQVTPRVAAWGFSFTHETAKSGPRRKISASKTVYKRRSIAELTYGMAVLS
jgi:hypothetical protein